MVLQVLLPADDWMIGWVRCASVVRYLPTYLQPTGTSYLMKLMKLKWVDLTTVASTYLHDVWRCSLVDDYLVGTCTYSSLYQVRYDCIGSSMMDTYLTGTSFTHRMKWRKKDQKCVRVTLAS